MSPLHWYKIHSAPSLPISILKNPSHLCNCGLLCNFKQSVPAITYPTSPRLRGAGFPRSKTLFRRLPTFPSHCESIIGASGLNFWVRNETRCDPTAEPPEQHLRTFKNRACPVENVVLLLGSNHQNRMLNQLGNAP